MKHLVIGLMCGANMAAMARAAAASAAESSVGLPYPPLSVIHGTLLTTAEQTFGGDQNVFTAATDWHVRTWLSASPDRRAPYLGCMAPDQNHNALEALSQLREILYTSSSPTRGTETFGKGTVRVVSNSDEYGVCFVASANSSEADRVVAAARPSNMEGKALLLSFWVPFPSALKLAPGLLEYDSGSSGSSSADVGVEHNRQTPPDWEDSSSGGSRTREEVSGKGRKMSRLSTSHGSSLKIRGAKGTAAHGLSVELTPGVLQARNNNKQKSHEQAATSDSNSASLDVDLIEEWMEELMSEPISLHDKTYWSSSVGFRSDGEETPPASPGWALLEREWTRAADVVHELSGAGADGRAAPTVGEVCSWDSIVVYHTDDDLLTIKGIDHLLPDGRGAGGSEGDEADELQMACFMGLLSFLASRPEVLRVSAARKMKLLNAAAFSNVQSATLTETPLTDSGLDGTGEVIQVVDTGLDYNSCFFIDEDEQEVAHGHYFEEIGVMADALSSWSPTFSFSPKIAQVFTGGDFHYDLGRRKIVQYIDLIRQDDTTSSTQPYGASWATSGGADFPWISADEFAVDGPGGHGTHTAGSAAGATISNPATTEACSDGREVSCVGGCIDPDDFGGDDLVTTWGSIYDFLPVSEVDLDKLCPRYQCDGQDEEYCLGDDEGVTLAEHGGVARGAKLAIFDILDEYTGVGIEMAGNGIWAPAMEAGSKIHSNSWGGSYYCEYQPLDVMFDDFMYNNPENLLIFAAGNDGDDSFGGEYCTMGTPAVSKNSLSVGASTSGPGRLSWTGSDGDLASGSDRAQDIDTMAYFSSNGPTLDGRIKPDVVAPGDLVYSAAGSGTGNYTCRLWNYPGTSMATPLVAGAAALIRQYFKNDTFYADDVNGRGFCSSFSCEAFSPSAATVKAMLINSANLMGGSSEPDGIRGFGRVHLEPGMPLRAEGDIALFVADSSNTSTPELTLTEYSFEVDAEAGVDVRATLCWIDPAATTSSVKQLVHDLDLAIYAPDGTRYSMWSSGEVDALNNNERVIVPAADVRRKSSGTWSVRVWSKRLSASESQNYSLVVTGAISPPEANNGTVAAVVLSSSWSTSASSSLESARDDDLEEEDETTSGARGSRGSAVVFSVVALCLLTSLMASWFLGGGA